ncbi:MAG: hypothetical protein ACRC3H_14195 [Lachnospiraceae bacterium]
MLRICGLPVIFPGKDQDLAEKYELLFKEFYVSGRPRETVPMLRISVEGCEETRISAYDYELAPFRFLKRGYEIKVWNRHYGDGYVLINPPWNSAVIRETTCASDITGTNLLQIAFSSFLSMNQGLFMHGAVIAYQKSGIIFTASPGGGKSTQAAIWQSVLGAEIINGDKAMIRLKDSGVMVYGSPWSGSSAFRVNKGVPLKAIIVLEKGNFNIIHQMKGTAQLYELGKHIYFPYWHKNLINSTLSVLDALFRQVPIFRLTCKPDETAAFLVRETIFG